MRHTISRRAGTAALALAAAAAGLVAAGSTTADAAAPPWQTSGSDPNRAGTLSFFNSAGTQVYTGDIHDKPFAAFAVGSQAVRSGDTKASLFAYTPTPGSTPGDWSGLQLTAASTYPVTGAPGGVSHTLPVVTGTAGDTSLADYLSAQPNTSTDASYQGIYELRLRTGAPQSPTSPGYDVADVLVTGSTWQVVYPQQLTATTTTLTASPTSGAKVGSTLTLTAAVSPTAAPGSVQFKDGSTNLGTPVALSSSHASKAVVPATAGTHAYSAVYVPSSTSTYASSTGTLSYAVAKATPTVTAVWPTKITYGTAWSVAATVTAPGTVPTGYAYVKYGSTVLGYKALSGGKATVAIAGTKLTPGAKTLVVYYGGSANVSTGYTTKAYTVGKAVARVTNALTPTTVHHTAHGKFVIHVVATGVNYPTGVVRVYQGSTLLVSANLTAAGKGYATITLPLLGVGKHYLHGYYAGSTLVTTGVGPVVTLTVVT